MRNEGIGQILTNKNELKEHIRGILKSRQRKTIPREDLSESAVLIPICWDKGEPRIIVTMRSMNVEHHKGEISFPGGRAEPDDEGLIHTALREAHEEIGLSPDQVDVLGILDDHISIMGYHITPVVGTIPYPYEFVINSESETLLYVPLRQALMDSVWMAEKTSFMGREINIYFLEIDGGVVWGATARMLKHFVDIISGRTIQFSPVSENVRSWVEDLISKQAYYQANQDRE